MSAPRLYLFNPENDVALASGLANFTPPAAAWQMHLSGEALPLWYASAGDRFHSFGTNARWLDGICSAMNIDVDVASDAEIASGELAPVPWGWSAYAARLFENAGYPAQGLPAADVLDRLRTLSGRALTREFNLILRDEFSIDAPVPEIVTSADRLRRLCGESPGYVKQPWSSSGRGVAFTGRMTADEVVRRNESVLRRQGYVMWERALDRITDFAMLYDCVGGKACFEGYSLFRTDAAGRYGGNVVAPQEAVFNEISRPLDSATLPKVRDVVAAVLDRLVAPFYEGPVGVDMMVYRRDTDGSAVVAPCIEVNLRHTMGFVACRFARRHLADGARGLLCVEDSAAFAASGGESFSLDSCGRIENGIMLLSPPSKYAFCLRLSEYE